jgi:hypothetical protein
MKTRTSQQELPPLSKADVATLKTLHQQWGAHTQRMAQLTPEQVLADQAAALKVFLASPTLENEQRLAVVADERLTRQRYRVLHDAYLELGSQAKTKGLAIIRRHLEQLLEAARQGLRDRENEALKQGQSRLLDERSTEMRQWVARIEQSLKVLDEAASHPDEWAEELLRWGEQKPPTTLLRNDAEQS